MLSIFETPNWVLLSSSTGLALLTTGIAAWINKNQKMWNDRVLQFRLQHHEYITPVSSSSFSSSTTQQKDVLLIVCPTSGSGMAMRNYETALTELENISSNQEGGRRQVEVYVTKSSDDLMSLATKKDLQPYKMIAILSGDSSVFEFVQPVLLLAPNNGRWPYAPILHLPGGTGNAMPGEFYNGNLDIRYIIRNATKIRKGSVVKASNGEITRYALHNCFGGFQAEMIEFMEARRALVSNFGGGGLILAIGLFLFAHLPFSKTLNPTILNVINSDYEGMGLSFDFGVDRFDDKMVVAVGGPYKFKWNLVMAFIGLFRSMNNNNKKLLVVASKDTTYTTTTTTATMEEEEDDDDSSSKNKEPVFELPHGVTCKVCDHWTLPNVVGIHGQRHYKLHFDGSTLLPLEGDSITLEVIPKAIPYYTVPRRQDNE